MRKYDHKKIEKKILNKNGRTAVFIDASNIYHSQKHLGFQIDFKKLLNYFKKKQICHQFTFIRPTTLNIKTEILSGFS